MPTCNVLTQAAFQPLDLLIKINIGGGGAPTLDDSTGVESVTRTSGGRYRVILRKEYRKELFDASIYHDRAATHKSATYVPVNLQESTGIIESYTQATGELLIAVAPQAIGLEISYAQAVTTNVIAKDASLDKKLFSKMVNELENTNGLLKDASKFEEWLK